MKFITFTVLLFTGLYLPAQSVITFSGGVNQSENSSVSWSFGEVVTTTIINSEVVTQGFQQPDNLTTSVNDPENPVFNGITATEGVNEHLVFTDLNPAAQNELLIFNRWGEIVFQTKQYQNDWGGTDQNGTELPQGTYYYIYSEDNKKTLKGSVHIVR